MKKTLVLGAGRSSYSLIQYLVQHQQDLALQVRIGDLQFDDAIQALAANHNASLFTFDVFNSEQVHAEVQSTDIVISMLPARFHLPVAQACVAHGKHLITASYISPEMQALDAEAKAKGILLLNEAGLDPGIDHMSAQAIIDDLQQQGADIRSFESFTGGLIAPESDNNPWNYKFTWNPRNVVLAGQGTAQYIENGVYKYIPYHRLFAEAKPFYVEGYGWFDGYANRDSLKYRSIYGLDNIATMLRGTLRKQGFCHAWNAFVQMGLTDDSFGIDTSQLTYKQFMRAFLPEGYHHEKEALAALLHIAPSHDIIHKIAWLGLFSDERIPFAKATPAQVLQHVLEQKWVLAPDDKDMIVMQHVFAYQLNDTLHQLSSSLVVLGDDTKNTAMAKTVGLPVAIAAKLLAQGQLAHLSGVHLPVLPVLYRPILQELAALGIVFREQHQPIA